MDGFVSMFVCVCGGQTNGCDKVLLMCRVIVVLIFCIDVFDFDHTIWTPDLNVLSSLTCALKGTHSRTHAYSFSGWTRYRTRVRLSRARATVQYL